MPSPTNWRAVPLSEFDIEFRPRSNAPLVGILGDSGFLLTVQYRDGIVEYDAAPTAESLNAFYRSSWMGQAPDRVRQIASSVSAQEPSGVRWKLLDGLSVDTALDVGAGYGDQIRGLKRVAKNVTVIEPCEVRAQVLREVYGCETLLGSFPDVKYHADLIVCHHVIEHVRDAEQVFDGFASCQPDGGRLVLTCPDFLWEPSIGVCLFWPHLRSFTRDGLLMLAGRFGYTPELDLSSDHDLAFRFVKRCEPLICTGLLSTDGVLDKLMRGLGIGGRRLLTWERDYDGAAHVGSLFAAIQQKRGGIGRCLEIEDIAVCKTDCPIEIQWDGETQVFVK